MLGDIPILLLLLSQTLIIEPLHVWLSTIVIIGIISGWAYRNGLAMGKKADIDKVVLKDDYLKDVSSINSDFDDVLSRVERIEHQYLEQLKENAENYRKMSNSLTSLTTAVQKFENFCTKNQNCNK